MTDQPIAAATTPVRVDLTEGETYHWCRCGRSGNQPFCDGSHEGTGITPLAHTATRTGAAVLCRCKATKREPFCDGSHSDL